MKEYATFGKSRAPRLKTFDYSDPAYVYFLTICTYDKQPHFTEERSAQVMVDTLLNLVDKLEFNLYAWCLMPDHLHLLISPSGKMDVKEIVKRLKGISATRLRKMGIRGGIWQKSFYDHIIRRDESLLAVAEYVLENPVRKGLSARYEDYPYCSWLHPLPL
jgi:REP element-mobilizing transposase RayT